MASNDAGGDRIQREGARPSVWEATAEVPAYPKLASDERADVCVVGAGIAGLTTAYHLLQAGRSVIVLDDGPIGGGETGRTTAHIATSVDDYYHEVAKVHGAEAARRVAESFVAGVDRIEQIVREENIDCDFIRLDGWWFPADNDGRTKLADELTAAHAAGLTDVEMQVEWPLSSTFGGPGLRFPRQAQFHALEYLSGLARAIERRGGRIFSGAHVTEFADGTPCTVKTSAGHTVTAKDVVAATNSPANDWVTMHTKQAPYRTYAIGLTVKRGAVPVGLYWDTLEYYHYVRLLDPTGSGDTDVLIVGGEDHKTGQADGPEEERFDRLEAWARANFPVMDVAYRWSGQVMEPVDYLAFIGRNPGSKHVYIATGDSGNGITHGTIAGMLLTALVTGTGSAWEKVYDPSRISLRTLPEFIKENVNVAAQYGDYATPGEVDDVAEVPAGEGRLVRRGATKVAAYRAPDGALTVCSAVCTHLYCLVDWNSAERTWDCPCHGSRFATDGSVINGPAVAPLERLAE